MSAEQLFVQLIERITHLERVVDRQAVRINNLMREGSVAEVDYATGLAIVNAQGLPSKPCPWLQHAGSVVDWDPPTVGQRVVLMSPSGDPGRSFILPGGYTDEFPQPYSDGEMFGRSIGATKITGSGSGYKVETPLYTIEGDVLIRGNIRTYGRLFNNDVPVDSLHKHGGIIRGSEKTDPPS